MEDQNNFYYKPAYKCGICGSEHETVQSRMNCEMACLKNQKEEERKAAEAKKVAEQKLRKEAVDEAIKRAAKLQNDYVKDYGHYEYEGEIVPNIFWPNKIWHLF
jgi:hypothetical protein